MDIIFSKFVSILKLNFFLALEVSQIKVVFFEGLKNFLFILKYFL